MYAVGHRALTREGRWLAAVLAAGDDAVLSHATAAAAWDLRASEGVIHVTVPGDPGRRRLAGVRIHRSRTLTPDQTTVHRGIPITTPARTIIDLSRTLTGRPLEQLVNRAERLVDFDELRQATRSRSLKAQLSRYTPTLTRSELEEAFLRLCDDYGIQRPETNAIVEGFEVDFLWRDKRLIVEVDGYEHHRTPTAFETDRERDVILTLAQWRVMRFTWTQVHQRPAWVAAAVTSG